MVFECYFIHAYLLVNARITLKLHIETLCQTRIAGMKWPKRKYRNSKRKLPKSEWEIKLENLSLCLSK